jgi:hypothetical protein
MPSSRESDVELKRRELAITARSIAFNLLAAVVGAVFTFLGLVATGYFTWWKDSKEVDLKMIDIALGILIDDKGDGEDSQPMEARRFAIEILKGRSGIEMDEDVWEGWIKSQVPLSIPPSVQFGWPPTGFGTLWGSYNADPRIPPVLPQPGRMIEPEELFAQAAFQLKILGKWAVVGNEACTIELEEANLLGLRPIKRSEPCTGTPVGSWESYYPASADSAIVIYNSIGEFKSTLEVRTVNGLTTAVDQRLGISITRKN